MATPFLRRLAAGLALVLSLGALAACENTIRGIGQDVEDTGDAVGDTLE